MGRTSGFTLIELLVVLVIIAILGAILFPVFASAREKSRETTCESNLRQIGLAMAQYQQDYDELFPSRRDLKAEPCPPWSAYTPPVAYPASDPRCGWATVVLDPYVKNSAIWVCPSVAGNSVIGNEPEVLEVEPGNGVSSDYWMWGFDHDASVPEPIDDFWGKTDQQAVTGQDEAYQQALATNTPYPKGDATSTADCELATDPYFPNTPNVLRIERGLAVHFGGRERLYLDGHVKWYRDARLND